MAKELYFDSYDFDRNERGFSAEELETVRRMLSEGKRVWMAPVVIDEEGQMETLFANRNRCRTWKTGLEKRLVYLTPADESTFTFLKSEMDSKRKREERNHRCLIQGMRNDYIRCPECYHCSQCPFGRNGEVRTGRFVSRDLLLETELETAVCRDTPEEIILRQEMLSEIRERMRMKMNGSCGPMK